MFFVYCAIQWAICYNICPTIIFPLKKNWSLFWSSSAVLRYVCASVSVSHFPPQFVAAGFCVPIAVQWWRATSVSGLLFLLAAFQLDFLKQGQKLSPLPGSVSDRSCYSSQDGGQGSGCLMIEEKRSKFILLRALCQVPVAYRWEPLTHHCVTAPEVTSGAINLPRLLAC